MRVGDKHPPGDKHRPHPMLTPRDVAEVLQVSPRTVLQEIHAKRLRARWLNRRVVRIHPDWLREYTMTPTRRPVF